MKINKVIDQLHLGNHKAGINLNNCWNTHYLICFFMFSALSAKHCTHLKRFYRISQTPTSWFASKLSAGWVSSKIAFSQKWKTSISGRFKKILNSMPRLHFLFVLHRLVLHRNRCVFLQCEQYLNDLAYIWKLKTCPLLIILIQVHRAMPTYGKIPPFALYQKKEEDRKGWCHDIPAHQWWLGFAFEVQNSDLELTIVFNDH